MKKKKSPNKLNITEIYTNNKKLNYCIVNIVYIQKSNLLMDLIAFILLSYIF